MLRHFIQIWGIIVFDLEKMQVTYVQLLFRG